MKARVKCFYIMNKRDYHEQLQDPRWIEKRKEVLFKDEYTCQRCGAKNVPLQVHHLVYYEGRKAWEYSNAHLVSLCKKCHYEVHNELLKEEGVAKVGQVYSYTHGDFENYMYCYHVDYLHKKVFLIGINTGGSWHDLYVDVFSFDTFFKKCIHLERFFNWNFEDDYFQAKLVRALCEYAMGGYTTISVHNNSFEEIEEERDLQKTLRESFNEDYDIFNMYVNACNNDDFLLNL